MKECPDCGTRLIINNYDPMNAVYAPADYCINCDKYFDYDEDYETPQAWKKITMWGALIVLTCIALKLIF